MSLTSPTRPTGLLSIGNVVSAAFRLYRDRLSTYLGISGRVALWSLLPWLCVAAFSALFFFGLRPIALLLVIPLGIFIFIYCAARALTETALISRLAFGILSDRPESASEARSQLQSKTWKFLWVQILLSLVLVAVNFGLSIAQTILSGIFSRIVGHGASLVSVISILVINLASFVAYLYVYSRVFIPEVPMAIESKLGAPEAMNRSWQLSEGSAWRIVGIVTIANLLTMPLYAIAFVPAGLWFVRQFALLVERNTYPSSEFLVQLAIYFGGLMIFALAISWFVLPFWQALKSTIYYDLCSRREGLDLQPSDP
jgi:hypothetical protein